MKTDWFFQLSAWDIGKISKINPLINPVNPRGTCWDKTYYYNLWDSVQRTCMSNYSKINPLINPVNTREHDHIKPIIIMFGTLFREAKHLISYS